MWLIWIIVTLVFIKIYNKLSSGRCYSDSVMSGKVVLITGAASGIGYETALELARRGAKVTITSRDVEKGKRAVESIVTATKNSSVRHKQLDLSSLTSVRNFVEEFKSTEVKLDVLINNASGSVKDNCRTADGIVKDVQVNHFGPFLLTVLLVPMLKKAAPSRVINVSSVLHKLGTIERINEEGCYGYLQGYSNSKLCNLLFSNELARRLKSSGVAINSLHPGQVSSYRSNNAIDKIWNFTISTFFKNPKEGAQTSIYLAVSDECDQVTGKYFVDCAESAMSPKAEDEALAAKLWSLSEQLVKLKPEEAI